MLSLTKLGAQAGQNLLTHLSNQSINVVLHWLLTGRLDESVWTLFQCIFSILQCSTHDSSLKYLSNHYKAMGGVTYNNQTVLFLPCCILFQGTEFLCCLTLFSVVLLYQSINYQLYLQIIVSFGLDGKGTTFILLADTHVTT